MKETKFKQTEVGMIPSDWEVKRLSDFAATSSGGTPSRSISDYYNGDIKWFTTTELKDCFLNDSIEHISEDAINNSSAKIFPKNTLLMAMYGATIGRLGILNFPAATNQACCAIFPKNNDVQYLYYFFLHNRDNIVAMGCGAGQPNISQEIVKKILVPLPPTIEEQKRIAQALSDVDAVISTTEKLIAKKKALKQGTMQTLLSGKMRIQNGKWIKTTHFKQTELGPIPQEWEVKTIGDLGSFLGGGTPSTKNESFWKGHIPWISSADLNDDDIDHISTTRFISLEAVNSSATQICPQGTILIIARVGVGKLALSAQKVCTSQDFCNLIPSKENNPKFLAYALLPVMKNMANESQGTSIKGVAVDEIKKTPIAVPSLKGEQTAIATILSDMDAEIAALETKLAKYRQLKTGMMQQLLTGKIRLIK